MAFVLNVMELVLFLKMTFKIFASLAKTKSILVIYISLLHNITGGIAEAFYGGVPEQIRKEVLKRLPNEFIEVMQKFYQKFVEKNIRE